MGKATHLYEASQAVLSTLDPDEVLRQILTIARDHFQLRNVLIFLLDKEKGDLWVRSQIGIESATENLRVVVGHGITGAAAQQKRPVYVPDVSKDSNYIKSFEKTRSEAAIPLIVGGEVVGVLDCQSEHPDHFDAESIDLLALFATQASMALQNARLYALERRRTSQLEAIAAIAQQATAVLELDQLLNKMCVLICNSFSVAHVSMLLKQHDGLVLRAHHGCMTLQEDHETRLRSEDGFWHKVLGESGTLIENEMNAKRAELFRETASRMCIPLVSCGQTFGALVLHSSEPQSFQAADMRPLESVADICATAIQNANYVERVKQLAYRDGLTGIFNRRFFELRMTEELDRAQRFGAGMAVIMVDIDRFKSLNDEFGHLLGDEVLRQVSSILHDQLRKFDVVCRYGGEEFAILLSQTHPQHAMGVAEKLRSLVERWQFPAVPRAVTISAGIAAYPQNGVTREELMKAADSSLYAAKQHGRNRVELAASDSSEANTKTQAAGSA
jgi:diguanylate cyclase (GGDEF)-like protein